jgi:hypothetical protein
VIKGGVKNRPEFIFATSFSWWSILGKALEPASAGLLLWIGKAPAEAGWD